MSFFDLDPTATDNLIDQARLNPLKPSNITASWYEGTGTAMISGMKTAYERDVFNAAGPSEQQRKDEAIKSIIELRPDPHTVGTLGQFLYGAGDQLGTLFLNFMGGNVTPVTMAQSSGVSYAKSQEQVNIANGMDPATARSVANIEGAGVGLGAVLPASAVGGVAVRAATGGALNTLMGVGQRTAISSTLKGAGYEDMAQQYKPFAGADVLTDFTIGALFGGLLGERPGAKAAVKPSDLDTSLTLNNAAHLELDTAPGIPATPAARNAHVDTMNQSLESLLVGEPVRVDEAITRENFIENPAAIEFRNSVVQVVEEHLGADWAALQAELKSRGLPTDEVDSSAIYKVATVPARITSEVPNAVMGDEASVKISGTYYPVRWALVDAANVEATMAKADNQFRDRSRAASQAQVSKIAAEPDFNLLGHSPIMDFGAPTLTRDGKIIGGNGRFEGVSQAYERGTAEGYRKPLKENLQRFGIDPAQADGMKKPVLVRVLQADVDVQKAAMASNEGAGLRMSALEQAKVDGVRLGDITGVQIGETGELNSPANRNFLKQWVSQFPTTEAAALIDKDGQLSVEGTTRLRNAILYRAYGDSPTLARLVESTDPGAKNVATALLRTAPMVAEAKDAIAAGKLFPLDISNDVAGAVETLDKLRVNGMKVSEYLSQGDFFGSELTPEGRKILQFFGENMRSPKAMSELIANYYANLKKAGDPSQGNMLGLEAPTKGELLDLAVKQTGKDLTAGMAELPFQEDIGVKLERRLKNDFEGAAKEYAGLEESNGGQILNTDIARELSPEYRADRTRSADVHEPASQFIKDLYAQKLAAPTPAGKVPTVLFTGGGTGAGKSTGLKLLGKTAEQAEIIYDTNMNKLDSAVTKIEQALDADRNVTIVYTFRDPMEALTMGALPRAMRMGRTVPLSEHAKTHIGARTVVDQLAEKYKGDNRVNIIAIDNSRGYQNAAIIPLAEISKIDHIGLEGRLYEATKAEHAAGNISDAVYRGTTGEDVPRGMVAEGSRGNAAQSEQVGSGRAASGSAGKSDPYSADSIAQSKPNMEIASESGDPVPAQKAIAQADAEIETAKRDSQGFEAAAACELRG